MWQPYSWTFSFTIACGIIAVGLRFERRLPAFPFTNACGRAVLPSGMSRFSRKPSRELLWKTDSRGPLIGWKIIWWKASVAFCWTRLVKWFVFWSLHFLRILAFGHWLWWLRTSPQPYATLQIFPVLFRAYHTDCLILDTPSWHLCGNSLDAPLSSGPDTDNFLLDAYCWYGRHYGSSLHPTFSASLNFHSADGSQRRADRFVLHPTPEGPFHERSFSCMMRIYTAQHFMAQPVFSIIWTRNISSGRCIRAWKNFHGKSGVPLAGQRCIEIRFHSASASTSLGTTLITDYVNFEHKCRFADWLARVASRSNPADQPSR